jgi:hypothetical protein
MLTVVHKGATVLTYVLVLSTKTKKNSLGGSAISLPLSVLGRNSLIAFLVITLHKFVLWFWLLFWRVAVVV